ncbi:MAG: hypothetical protein K0Q49_1283 [Haloplasmataceae bacterium]|jgi:hypothetical protein|nr:hypothetical protein [Haloplasmataceae bacterium]
MKLEVVISKNELSKGRLFSNLTEASQYMRHNEKMIKIGNHEVLVDTLAKSSNELIRKVYQNSLGQKRYYILKIIN